MENASAAFNNQTYHHAKLTHYCPSCNSQLHHRVSRSWLVKNLFFFVSLKRYRCDKCFKSVYVRADRSILAGLNRI